MTKTRQARGAAIAKFHELRAIQTDDCVIWPYGISSNDYGRVTYNGNKHNVHRLALILASRIEPPGYDAAHACHTRLCMNVRHLRWATRAENEADKIADGVASRGERHPRVKLTEATVHSIRESRSRGRDLASRFGVNESCISKIRSGKTWQHLP